MKTGRPFLPLLALPALLLMLSGCGGFSGVRPAKTVSGRAGDLLTRIDAINSRLTACKGTGTITLRNAGNMPRMEFAWLCSPPDKIRLELLAPTGQPLITLSSDGSHLYFLPHTRNGRVHKIKEKGMDLERILSVPLPISDASQLLAGRIPILDFDTAERLDRPGGEYILRLNRQRPRAAEDIVFEGDSRRPVAIEFFQEGKKEPEYTVELIGSQKIDNIPIPESIELINNHNGRRAMITIDRFWTSADVSADKFILTDAP